MLMKRTAIYNKKGDVLKRGRESIQNECTFDFKWIRTKIIKAIEMGEENTALIFYLLNLKFGKIPVEVWEFNFKFGA